ncbi:MAG: ROK family protein [Alistipes sp.]
MEIGVDLGGTNVRVGRVDQGQVVELLSESCKANAPKQVVVDQIITMIERLITPNVDRIGVGVPSIVDTDKGIVYNVISIPSWDEVPLKSIIEERFGISTSINNDCNCFALGICHFGEGRGYKDVVCVALGTGVGAGVVINHKLYSGHNTGAGEIGSVQYLDKDYEYYCSSRFFIGRGTSGKGAYDKAIAGDREALALWQEFGTHIGNLVMAILYTYDPQAIVFGGSIANAYNLFAESMNRQLGEFPYPQNIEKLKICTSSINNITLLGSTVQ